MRATGRWGLVLFIVVNTIKYTYNSLIDMGGLRLQRAYRAFFKKNLNASKPSEHPPQVEECLKV